MALNWKPYDTGTCWLLQLIHFASVRAHPLLPIQWSKRDKQVLADSSVIVCGLSCWDPKGTHTWTEGAYNHFTADKLVGKRKRKREKEKKREREWEKEKEKEKEKKRKRMCLFLSSVWQPS